MLLVAGLAIGCSSAPEAPAAPAGPVANPTENEAIAIARSSDGGECFMTESYENSVNIHPYRKEVTYKDYTNFTSNKSASFKPSGIWVVTAKTSWAWEYGTVKIIDSTRRPFTIDENEKYSVGSDSSSSECTIVVDDATGTVKR